MLTDEQIQWARDRISGDMHEPIQSTPSSLQDVLTRICVEVIQRRSADRWISIREGLPNNDDYYEVEFVEVGLTCRGIAALLDAGSDGRRWYLVGCDAPCSPVVRYRPLRS